ncbi:hypothetical protein QE109_14565 [Fusibacter bizertensis]|jgi:hypothetical protein|uniref:Transcriptional regulator n=1 Tax=Fusibacter bizertensis TaxID=1488331 RepID=A0ABT6NG93_9FIRM|nr:hypothetical protein [Fusibacter bizertensis]MDH8679378.1 hypothetical protein [Fusibacter bizertensis]
MKFLENIALFFTGALGFNKKAYTLIEKDLRQEEDNFLLAARADLLGLNFPTMYYMLELIPYMVEEEEAWIKRMVKRKSIWEERFSDLDIDP